MLMQAGTDGESSRKVHCGVKYGSGGVGWWWWCTALGHT